MNTEMKLNLAAINRIALQSILHKEITRFMRIWSQTLQGQTGYGPANQKVEHS